MKKNRKPLDKLIRSKINEFTATEKKIANFFLDGQHEVAFLSIHDLSDQLMIGRASIIRFANKLGFKGYLELKREISARLQENIAPLERYKIILNNPNEENNSINKIAENEVSNINFVLNNFDKKSFDRAIEIISKAQYVYVIGFNLSSFLAGITCYLMQRIGLKSFPINLGGLSFPEQLINVDENDVLIAFSLPPYSRETIEATEFAKKQHCKIISFTNSFTSPIVSLSDVTLRIQTNSKILTNSISSAIVLIDTLINELALKNKKHSVEVINKAISLR